MKELVNQYRPQIYPLQRDLSLIILSHLANRNLGNLDSNASLVLNNISVPVEFEFPNEEEANKAVLKAVARTLDVLWGESSSKNVKEQQLIDRLYLLKKQGISKAEIVERLSLHFTWGLNSQKI